MRRISNLILIAVTVLIALGVGEFAVRKAAPQPLVASFLSADADLGFVLKPDQNYHERLGLPLYEYDVRTNHEGFRMDQNVDPAKRKAIALGDSFTFGWGVQVDQNFVSQIAAKTDAHIQLVNAGVGGYASSNAYKALVRYSQSLSPCATIYFLNPNDPFDNIDTNPDNRVMSYRRDAAGKIVLTDEKAFTPFKRFLLIDTPYSWLNQNSHLFTLTKHAGGMLLGHRSSDEPAFGTGELGDTDPQLLIDVTVAYIDLFAKFSQEHKIPVMVAWIPAWSELFDQDPKINALYAQLKEQIRQRPLVFVDPTAKMHAAAAGLTLDDLFFRDGKPVGHFNPRGNRLFAEEISEDAANFLSASCH